jgi:predicted deacylase
VPVAVAELGGARQNIVEFIDLGVRGVLNVLKSLGMLSGIPELPSRQLLAKEFIVLRSHHGGVLLSDLDWHSLGHEVAGGTELGRLISPYDFEVLETFRAPYERSLVALVNQQISELDSGDYAFMLANRVGAVPV